MRKNTSVDWTIRESVRAKIRVVVKRILKAHGFPCGLPSAPNVR
jgi:type I restriction enzyme R subunit